MQIDLECKMPKVTDDSERTVKPADTVAMVNEKLAGLGFKFCQSVKNLDDCFWVAEPDRKTSVLPDSARGFRMGGKGISADQCRASGCMELIERWSLRRLDIMKKPYVQCLDLRENRTYELKPVIELLNTKCTAAGNNYEEAILHCLHELIETRTSHTDYFRSCRIVDTADLFPEMPEWVNNSILLIQNPVPMAEFYKFTAIQYPFNNEFDDIKAFRLQRDGGRIRLMPERPETKRHSPNSGGAAGINPMKTALRAMNEIFQFQSEIEDFTGRVRKKVRADFPSVGAAELINYETESITDDIKFILKILGEDVFVGIIDLTDPELGIPVVKLISDWEPNRSLVSKDILSEFFYF